ncbi:MAG: tetratricopeptide repeat protein [Acidobacteriaceae bacterium]
MEQLVRAHDYDRALKEARSSLALHPRDYGMWTLEGIVLSIKGEGAEALKAYDRALKLSPDYPAALKGEVQLYSQTQDKRAIPLLKRILRLDPSDQTAHEMLALQETRQGDCDAADEQFGLSTDSISAHPESLAAFGDCLVQTGQPEKAVPVFQQLSALLPKRAFPKYDLAVVLMQTKQHEEALMVLAPLLNQDPPDPDVLSVASDAYEAEDNTPKAVALLRQAIVLDPTNAGYYTAFARLCLDHESFQVGVDMLSAGLTRISNDPSLYISRGLLYAQLAKYDKAEADFKTAEHLDSVQSISAYAIDLAELQNSSPESELTNVRAQLKVHPDSAFLHYLLAKLLSNQESGSDAAQNKDATDEAIRSALMALNLKPDMTEAHDLLGSLYADEGEYSVAIEQSRLALRANPADQTAIYHLIVALRHDGQTKDREEIPLLVKQLASLQDTSRKQESERKRFKLVEQDPVIPH